MTTTTAHPCAHCREDISTAGLTAHQRADLLDLSICPPCKRAADERVAAASKVLGRDLTGKRRPFPVCESCGKSTRSHKRPRYCGECGASVEKFTQRFNAPKAAPIRLYRFAFGIHDTADELYTLALIPARSDSEAFDKGCALMPADAPTLARDYWRRANEQPRAGTEGAFFTTQEIEDGEYADLYAGEVAGDVNVILGGFGQ